MIGQQIPPHVFAAVMDELSATVPLPVRERRRYRAQGFKIIEPGSLNGIRYGFTRKRWSPDSFLAQRGGEVFIALVAAHHRGRGYFRDLVAKIEQTGRTVVVIAPLEELSAILLRWGFVPTAVGSTFADRLDEWRRPHVK